MRVHVRTDEGKRELRVRIACAALTGMLARDAGMGLADRYSYDEYIRMAIDYGTDMMEKIIALEKTGK